MKKELPTHRSPEEIKEEALFRYDLLRCLAWHNFLKRLYNARKNNELLTREEQERLLRQGLDEAYQMREKRLPSLPLLLLYDPRTDEGKRRMDEDLSKMERYLEGRINPYAELSQFFPDLEDRPLPVKKPKQKGGTIWPGEKKEDDDD